MIENKNNEVLPPFFYYSLYLKTIAGINFTQREIDIIACIVKGRSSKKISTFLNISPRTVETHVRHISQKLECHSRENIIDFIEKTKCSETLKNYYSCLLVHHAFIKVLSQLSDKDEANPWIIVHSDHLEEKELLCLHQLKLHLSLLRCKGEGKIKKQDEILYELNKDLNQQKAAYYILLNKTEQLEAKLQRQSYQYFKFTHDENHYFSLFELLKKLFPQIEIDKLIIDFMSVYQGNQHTSSEQQEIASSNLNNIDTTHKNLFSNNISNQKNKFLKGGIVTFIIVAIISILAYGKNKFIEPPKEHKIKNFSVKHINVVGQKDSFLLLRPKFMNLIDKSFKQQQGIIAVALVGPGGIGKTTLARQYARTQKSSVAWEINSETKTSIHSSFMNLAQTLSQTQKDQQAFQEITKIQSSEKKQEKLVEFISTRLKSSDNWLLIYDNLEKLTDLKDYFPHDTDTWGRGKILITTRDATVQNSPLIHHAIQITELSQDEKLKLFAKITENNNVKVSQLHEAETRLFLNKLPPYPLDISIAAHYLRTANIPYATYLNHLSNYDEEFLTIQENLLKESGNYTKTRTSIITLSLQNLIQTHKDFADLLLFICLLDSQDIPREIINSYKKDITVDNFIYHLKKHSLITSEKPCSPLGSTFSIHRSFQEITLAYLTKVLTLKENKQKLQEIVSTFETKIADAISKDNLEKIKPIIPHCKALLAHSNLLTSNMKASIESSLGFIYYCLSNYEKAKDALQESLKKLKNSTDHNYYLEAKILAYLGLIIKTTGDRKEAKELLEKSITIYKSHALENSEGLAWALLNLGDVYRNLGLYDKAKDVLEKSLVIYTHKNSENLIGKARALLYLGTVYRDFGNYQQAIDTLEQSLAIYKAHVSKDHLRIARILAHLGNLHRELGDNLKAKELTEESLTIYEKVLPKNHIDIGWTLTYLGRVRINMGDYVQARILLEKSLEIHKQHYPTDHIEYAWVCAYLGEAYSHLKEYNKAKILLQNSLKTYTLYYGENHIETAIVLMFIGQIYASEDYIEMAETYFKKALSIYEKSRHPNHYKSLESLAKIYLTRARMLNNKGNIPHSQFYEKQAINHLKHALKILQQYYPEVSPHLKRIQEKLKKIDL